MKRQLMEELLKQQKLNHGQTALLQAGSPAEAILMKEKTIKADGKSLIYIDRTKKDGFSVFFCCYIHLEIKEAIIITGFPLALAPLSP